MARLVLRCGVALAGVAALAACGRPPGVDGNLTNGWAAMPAAKVAVPVAGACYPKVVTDVWYGDFTTVPCSGKHQAETVFVGAFPKDQSAPPTKDSDAQVDAYAQCQKSAASYLGADYHEGLLELLLVQPSVGAWNGGARWYRCDVVRYADANLEQVQDSGGSAKGGLSGSRSLAVTCKTVTQGSQGTISDEQLTDCAKPHNAEFAGLYSAPDTPWIGNEQKRDDLASDGCEAVVAKFLGLSGKTVTNAYLGWEYVGFNQDMWQLGDRTIQCFALGFKGDSPNGARFVGSVKGIKGGKPKAWS